MTKEEEQAYFEKCRKEAEDRCTIKTQEQFISECQKAAISEEWYGWNCGRTKPVSIEENMVLYRKIGKTLVSYPFQRWDIAFEELLKYRDQYNAFVLSGVKLQIDNVVWRPDAEIISERSSYPYFTIRRKEFAQEPDQALIHEGWIFDNYDHYMGYCNYHKTVHADSLSGRIVVEFTKLTDERDKRELGLTDVFMKGSYSYPVPDDMKERLYRCTRSSGSLPALLRREMIRRVEKTIIEDEFYALVRLRKEHLNALLNAVDRSLTEKEQKTAFADAGRTAEEKNPASDNIYGSRSYVITHKNFDIAYEKAGISR